MAGYMLRRILFSSQTCQSKFVVTRLSENDLMTGLLKAKAYREMGTLIYTSHLFASLLAQFVQYFFHIVHMEKVLVRLVHYAELVLLDGVTCSCVMQPV